MGCTKRSKKCPLWQLGQRERTLTAHVQPEPPWWGEGLAPGSTHLALHAALQPVPFSLQPSFQEAFIHILPHTGTYGHRGSPEDRTRFSPLRTTWLCACVRVSACAHVCELRDTREHTGSHYGGTPAVASGR